MLAAERYGYRFESRRFSPHKKLDANFAFITYRSRRPRSYIRKCFKQSNYSFKKVFFIFIR